MLSQTQIYLDVSLTDRRYKFRRIVTAHENYTRLHVQRCTVKMSGEIQKYPPVSDDEDEVEALVVDLGSGSIKAGFAGDDAPRAVFPSIIGRHRYEESIHGTGYGSRDAFIGDAASCKRGMLSIEHPIQHGVVTNWDDLEAILNRTFYVELRKVPQEHPVLLTEHLLNPEPNREKLVELMFDNFNSPAVYLENQGILTMVASGTLTGLAVDSGAGVTHMIPMYLGSMLKPCIQKVNLGGRDLDEYFSKLLQQRGYTLTETGEMLTVGEIKNNLTYTALDYDAEMQKSLESSTLEKSYQLPDGQTIHINKERFMCSEPMFNPQIIGMDVPGIHKMIHNCVMKCPQSIRKDILCNIVLAGGNTMFSGFHERLQKELTSLVPETVKCKVVAPPERKYSAWIGGSILSSLSNFKKRWITKEQYDEEGPFIVHKMCR